jgi:hypothetical protein
MEQEQAVLDLMLAKLLKDNGCSTREELMRRPPCSPLANCR